MDGHTYIRERQSLWAQRHNMKLVGSQPGKGVPSRTTPLQNNFVSELSQEHLDQFGRGDGNPLGGGKHPGKLASLHSSDAIAANVFAYWSNINQIKSIAAACRVPATQTAHIGFEAKFPIFAANRRPPNIDVGLYYNKSSRIKACGIESKFTEPYSNYSHHGLDEKYLAPELDELWKGLKSLRKLGESIAPDDQQFPRLHPAQLIKHILGMTRQCGRGRFRLLYLWYDVPCPEGDEHRRELAEFTAIAGKDDVAFQSMTWQQLILSLAKKHRAKHKPYIDYLCERYL